MYEGASAESSVFHKMQSGANLCCCSGTRLCQRQLLDSGQRSAMRTGQPLCSAWLIRDLSGHAADGVHKRRTFCRPLCQKKEMHVSVFPTDLHLAKLNRPADSSGDV